MKKKIVGNMYKTTSPRRKEGRKEGWRKTKAHLCGPGLKPKTCVLGESAQLHVTRVVKATD